MGDTGIVQQKTNMQRISDSIDAMRAVKDKAEYLMERLLNGDIPDHRKPLETAPNAAVFMSLWECLPSELDHIGETINGVLNELEKRLLG